MEPGGGSCARWFLGTGGGGGDLVKNMKKILLGFTTDGCQDQDAGEIPRRTPELQVSPHKERKSHQPVLAALQCILSGTTSICVMKGHTLELQRATTANVFRGKLDFIMGKSIPSLPESG